MIFIVMKNGKVLQYNEATHYSHDAQMVNLWTGKDGHYAVAKIPNEVIERVEFYRPCRVMREKPLREIKKRY